MKTPILVGIACAGLLVACTPEQVIRAQSYQDKIAGACSGAMSLSPIAGPIAPYIIGGCGAEEMIAKLALNPTSLAWINGLIAMVKGMRD